MPVNDRELLKQKVEAFLQGQLLYDPKEPVKVDCDEDDLYYILYGSDLFSGVGGFVETANDSFKDFEDNWDIYRFVKSNKAT